MRHFPFFQRRATSMVMPTSMSEELSQTPHDSPEGDTPAVPFPLTWLMDRSAPAIAYRAFTEVAGNTPDERMWVLPYTSPDALALAMTQSLDGSWNHAMLQIPTHGFDDVGTIPAVQRLIEYGWDRESPSLVHARRLLFRVLAEDNDPRYLFELSADVKNVDMAIRARITLREAAAAALAQAGYEDDPRLRGAARRIIERVDNYLLSGLSEKPFARVGNRNLLSADAQPPSIFTLMMLAHMPIFRSEHFPEMERLYAYVAQTKPSYEPVQLIGGEPIPQPQLVLGDWLPTKSAADSDIPMAFLWLETMARLNFLKRNETWMALFTRYADDLDRNGVWRRKNGPITSSSPYTWPSYPLESRQEGDTRFTDITFRIGLIARLLGWQINVV